MSRKKEPFLDTAFVKFWSGYLTAGNLLDPNEYKRYVSFQGHNNVFAVWLKIELGISTEATFSITNPYLNELRCLTSIPCILCLRYRGTIQSLDLQTKPFTDA